MLADLTAFATVLADDVGVSVRLAMSSGWTRARGTTLTLSHGVGVATKSVFCAAESHQRCRQVEGVAPTGAVLCPGVPRFVRTETSPAPSGS